MTLEERRFEGVAFPVDVSKPREPAVFVLGVRKSGSSMFNRAMKLLAGYNDVNWIDVPGTMFRGNIAAHRWRGRADMAALIAGGNAYGGFRDCPTALTADPAFASARKVLLVRDPRDAIVSEYFSNRGTHSLPAGTDDEGARAEMLRKRAEAQATAIDAFAREQAPRMARTMLDYAPLLADAGLLLLRYEEIIFAKAEMLRAVAAHLGWQVSDDQIATIRGWIDVVPEREDEGAFIRRVTPGDHREKLSAETLAAIAPDLAPAMRAFGYA